jgi:hypothetical protein
VQKAVVPYTPELLGEQVLKQQPEKPLASESAGFVVPALAVLVAKRDMGTVICDEIPLTQHAPVEIT